MLNIQVLRAFAAYLIVIAHMNTFGMPLTEYMFPGVDLFFVISGFIMVQTTAGQVGRPSHFLAKRLVRIVPLYWLLTGAISVAAIAAPSMMNNTKFDLTQLIKSMVFIGYDKHDGLVRPLLATGWTLNLEMLYYVIFSVSLFIEDVRSRVAVVSGVIIPVVIWGIVSCPTDAVIKFYTSTIMMEFVLGMMLGLFRDQIFARAPRPSVSSAIGGLALLTMLSPLSTEGTWRMVFPGLPAAAVVFAALALEARGWRCTEKRILLLGAASYSTYLTHLFVIVPLSHMANTFGLGDSLGVLPVAVLGLVLVTVASLTCHAFVEKPMDRFLRSRMIGMNSSAVSRPAFC